ncbi:hypothetical protein [Azospirillum soli]|uniref:hypothetical protein n=1 Tax=Azospirillum soli TaxID=1304799 RepID=UPI001AEB982A|nr:hypothetical protein [Azospirillum soli]MBP2316528.1 hypothetical protein [Azospirillum soli]
MTDHPPTARTEQTESWEPLFHAVVDRLRLTDPERIEAWRYYVQKLPDLAASHAALDQTPAPSATRDRMKRIVAACDSLLEALQEGEPEDGRIAVVPELLWGLAEQLMPNDPNAAVVDGRADHAFEDAFSRVLKLRQAAILVRATEEARVAPGVGGKRHTSADGYRMTFGFLLDVYQTITDRPLGTSWNDLDQTAGGPLVDFLHLCLEAVGYEKSKNAIRTAVKRAVADRPPDRNRSAAPAS